MALIAISITGSLQFAVAPNAGHISTDTAWLPFDLLNYDTKAEQTPPNPMPSVDQLGTGQKKFAHSTTDLTANGIYHQFQALIPQSAGGAPSRLTKALWANFATGGSVTVYGLDPYADDLGVSVDGRVYEYCMWDGFIDVMKLPQRVMGWGGYVLTLDFYRMTRRIAT